VAEHPAMAAKRIAPGWPSRSGLRRAGEITGGASRGYARLALAMRNAAWRPPHRRPSCRDGPARGGKGGAHIVRQVHNREDSQCRLNCLWELANWSRNSFPTVAVMPALHKVQDRYGYVPRRHGRH
jgi:hypothetical protein